MDEMDSRTMEPMIEGISKTANDEMAALMVPLMLMFVKVFWAELALQDSWSIDQYDMVYFIYFAAMMVVFLLCSDVLLLNAQEVYHSWPIVSYLQFSRHRFLTRIEHWKLDEKEFDETLDPVLRELDSLCFSSQYFFINGLTAWGMMLIYFGLSITLSNGYPLVSDLLFFWLTPFTLLTCLVARRVLVYLLSLSQIWRIGTLPTVHYAVNEDVVPYDASQHLRSQPVKNKFLEKNRKWLLLHLAELITPDALERHRDYLMYHYESSVGEEDRDQSGQPKGHQKYDISEDEDSDDMDSEVVGDYKAVDLDKRQERIGMWWLKHGKRLVEMRRLVDGIVASNLRNECQQCGATEETTAAAASTLSVHQMVSLQDLVFDFDKKIKMGIDRLDKMHPVIAWRKFFQSAQLFETLCIDCSFQRKSSKLDADMVSDDSADPDVDFRYQQYEVKFVGSAKNIAALWLQGARARILRQHPAEIPTLSISQSSSDSDRSDRGDKPRSVMHISRAQANNVAIIRDDISSITESTTDSRYGSSRGSSETDSDSSSGAPGKVRRVMLRDDISDDSEEEYSASRSESEQQVAFYNDESDDDDDDDREDGSYDEETDNMTGNRAATRRRYDISSDSEEEEEVENDEYR